MARQAVRALGSRLGDLPAIPLRTLLLTLVKDYRLQAAIIFILHFAIGLVYMEVSGVDITANPGGRAWDWWWQTIPAPLLREKLWESLLYLHFQPPLFNLYGAVFHNLFPSDPLGAMQIANMLLGSAIASLIYLLVRLRTQLPWLAMLAGLVVALDPGLFLFEAYILYDVVTVFWLVTGVYFLAKYSQQQQLRYAVLFILCLNLLVLTRSAYHLLVVAAAVVLLVLAAQNKRKQIVVAGLLISLLSAGWYAKNAAVFGFFGGSSWRGMSLWHVASLYYSGDELEALSRQGIIDPLVAKVPIFSPASAYRSYGFSRTSEIALIGQDNRHNINLIAVDRVYEANALRLIAHEPLRYLRAVGRAYEIYAIPSAIFKHHTVNAEKIRLHATLVANFVQGHFLQRYTAFQFGSIFFVAIPLAIVGYASYFVYRVRQAGRSLQAVLAAESVELWILFLILYTTVVSITLEVGENNRERFYIEYLFVALVLIAGQRIANLIAVRVNGHEPDRVGSDR